MKVAFVFHKDPCAPPRGIDLVRLRALTTGLVGRGIEVEILSPAASGNSLEGVPVLGLDALEEKGRYDLVKTCYHYSVELLGNYEGPVLSRIVRIVDQKKPERDEAFRPRLLRCQEIIRRRSACLILNNRENEVRWRRLYGQVPPIALVPTGCPARIPPKGENPYTGDKPVMLFVGSLAAPRMVSVINEAAARLGSMLEIHLVGRNKSRMYGPNGELTLDPRIVDHGEITQDRIWDFVGHAQIGLALATGPDPFDNDVSKILDYLRGGLPALSEQPIINNQLVLSTGLGRVFRFGDVNDLVRGAMELLADPPSSLRRDVMDYMAREHSWDRRVDAYVKILEKTMAAQPPGPR